MLQPAIKYKEELIKLQHDIWFDDKYMYWNGGNYYSTMEICDNTWDKHQFVSVYDDEVVGYIGYNIARDTESAHTLSILSFTDHKFTFGNDLKNAIEDIFEKYKFRKLDFDVVIGNPAEKRYDEIMKLYGGRIVGILKDDVKLMNGEYHDRKLYEILAEEYKASKHKKQL